MEIVKENEKNMGKILKIREVGDPILGKECDEVDIKNINVSNNYITVDNEDWYRCRSTDLANMVLPLNKNEIVKDNKDDPNFK